jgi:hypothetical protein
MINYWREALTAASVTSSVAALLAAAVVATFTDMVGEPSSQVVARVLLFPFAFSVALLTTVPASLPVALLVPILRGWSCATVASLFCAVVVASSVASFAFDSLSHREQQGLSGYLRAGEWAFSLFNTLGIACGSIGAIAAFEITRRARLKKLPPTLPTGANLHTTR